MQRMAELTAQLTFRVKDECYRRLQEIAAVERRKMNEVARAILERGMAAYERDGQLFEPDGDGDVKATVTAERRELGNDKQTSRKRGSR